jgi:putative flippase GtrA
VFWPLLLGFFKSSPSWKKTSHQFFKYIVGGSIYFWVGYGLFALGYSVFHWWWLWAKLLGDVVGWSLNYVVQRYWAFSEHHKFREIKHVTRYVTIETIGFVIDYAMIGGLKAVGISPYIGLGISGVFFTAWSYLWYKYWVFPEN